MSVKEMKETLLKKIQETDDELFITSMLDYSQSIKEGRQDMPYRLSDAQKMAITTGKEQILRGEYVSDEEAEADLDKFFREEDKKWGGK